MIFINFLGGAHGNFLEVVCNVAAGIGIAHDPFDNLGASHIKSYQGNKLFESGHCFDDCVCPSNKVVAIHIKEDDLLPLSQVSLLRAGNYGYDNDTLEIDTYNKLSIPAYKWVLDTIIESFFANQIQDSYQSVKDPSWPSVTTIDDFNRLPQWIIDECKNLHNLELLELSADHPDCPRHVLREFFQIGFEQPEQHGFMKLQQSAQYDKNADVFVFDFENFYLDAFYDQIKRIADWAGIVYTAHSEVQRLHHEFLARQPYKDSKKICDQIVQNIIAGQPAPRVTLLEESYINAKLKKSGHECRY
jgi:hypothetical protein